MKKVMKVMDMTGDSQVQFDDAVDNEARSEARKFFDELMQKGAPVFSVKRDSHGTAELTSRVTKFEDLGEDNVVVPRIAGG